MKILITKGKNWYADKVGEVIEARLIDQDGDYDIDDYHYVSKEDCEEVIEHNSQLYRKVDRPVREGDTVLITKFDGDSVYIIRSVEALVNTFHGDFRITPPYKGEYYFDSDEEECVVLEPIESPIQPSAPSCCAFSYAEVSELLHEASRQTRIDKVFDKVAEINGAALKRLADSDKEPPTLTETDLIANLAKEVAELKRQLTHAKTDIADLEDRVDENEKDTEELKKQSQSPSPWALEEDVIELNSRLHLNEKYTEELIGRMNDLGDGVKEPRHKRSNLISELERRRHEALCKRNRYEDMGDEGNYRYFDGKMVALIEVIGIVKEALRNG